MEIFESSAKTGDGMDLLTTRLEEKILASKAETTA
jgi:hypothetical protein